MTLVEMMVGLGIGSLVFLALGSVTLYSARSFSSMVNYSDLNETSRKGLDRLSKEIRKCQALSKRTETNLLFTLDATGTNTLNFTWDKPSKKLIQVKKGKVNSTNTLLTDCSFWTNQIFQRTPTNGGFGLTEAKTEAQTKLVQLNWTCARGRVNTTNSESVQSMKVVIRRKTST